MAAARNLIAYAMDDRKRIFDKIGKSFILTNNLKGQTVEEWTREFKENETYRIHKRKNNVKIRQEIIALHKGDAKLLTLNKMEKIAKEYMRIRNPNAMYIAVPHFDKDHPHIHIVSSAVEYRSGKSLSMSQEEFGQIKKDIQAYQVEKYPELIRSVVRHGRKNKLQVTDKEYQYTVRTGKKTKREVVIELANACFQGSTSQESFLAALREGGLETYERRGTITGIIHEGIKYRFKKLGLPEQVAVRKSNRGNYMLKKLLNKSPEQSNIRLR